MAQIIWSSVAISDLDAIFDYIGRDSPAYAQLEIDRILLAVDRLQTFPLSGRVVPELERDDLREIILPKHRVVYQLIGENVEIATVHPNAIPLEARPEARPV